MRSHCTVLYLAFPNHCCILTSLKIVSIDSLSNLTSDPKSLLSLNYMPLLCASYYIECTKWNRGRKEKRTSRREWEWACQQGRVLVAVPESKGSTDIKEFLEKINRTGAVNFRITGILVLVLNRNKHYFILSHHLIRRWMFIKFKVLLRGQR